MSRFYFILGALLFLFVGYFLITHAFVIIRLTTVLGLLAVIVFIFVIGLRRLL